MSTDAVPPDADESTTGDASDEEIQEFVEEVESDPSQNPDDEDLERVRGG